MTPIVAVAALLGHLQLDHAVRLTPEVATVKQGDPLLVRVDVRFGLRRPSDYPRGRMSPSPKTWELAVSVRRPPGRGYEIVHTADYGSAATRESAPPPRIPKPYGHADAAFMWVVSDRGPVVFDVPGEFRKEFAQVRRGRENGSDAGKPEPRDVPVFDGPGEYLVRARVILRDADPKGTYYDVYSAPVAVRVEAQAPAAQTASDAVRPVLYHSLPAAGYMYPPGEADALRAALPELGISGAAAAARRVLALAALGAAPAGEPRRRALAECDRLRAGLPPVGRGAFDLDVADWLIEHGEPEEASARLRAAPAGPRRLMLAIRHSEALQKKQRP